jgi:DNA-binding NarL/FixJ family response regulator
VLTLYLTEINAQTLADLPAILNPAITLRLKGEQTIDLIQEGETIGQLVCQSLGWVDPDLLARFTPGQRRVFALLLEGKKNQEIGQTLDISEKGVEYHLKKIYAKVGVHSRLQLVRAVVERA